FVRRAVALSVDLESTLFFSLSERDVISMKRLGEDNEFAIPDGENPYPRRLT
ncbi:hypothetical protein KIS1582_5134, partial [Cytobacillus firmus]